MTKTSILTEYTHPTLIEVMAPHCVECRAMQPDLDAVAGAHQEQVDLVVVDATADTARAVALGVRGTPTLIAVNDGVEMARFTGRRSRVELAELFAAVAVGSVDEISTVSRSDRLVWSIAGVLLAGAGLLSGPSWILVAIGAGLVGYAALQSGRS